MNLLDMTSESLQIMWNEIKPELLFYAKITNLVQQVKSLLPAV